MCIAGWVWQSHPVYQFILLLNRDEYHNRPTTSASWWGTDHQNSNNININSKISVNDDKNGDENELKLILGGRDGVGGGTWFGCTKNGRLAFLTNFRELDPPAGPDIKSRGRLPVAFLQSTISPLEFAKDIADDANLYPGFNLILTDLCSKTMVYVSNRPKGEKMSIEVVPPGFHVLSNAKLDSPWPKALRLRNNLSDYLTSHENGNVCVKEMIEKLMTDTTKPDRNMLHDVGCTSDWEYMLSSIFIEVDTPMGRYGTRSTIAVLVDASGDLSFYERYLEDGVWKDHQFQFHIKKLH